MSGTVQPPTPWIYEGIWAILTGVFCVPRSAPELPTQDAQSISSRKPSRSYLQYMKLQLCLVVAAMAIPAMVAIIVSITLAINESPWFLLATAIIVCVAGFLTLIAFLAIQLRYDTMWYVFSDRSMRLRRGIWVIRESTITFENIQNVKVIQGPLQRWFGISNVVVETAGGGGSNAEQGGGLGMHSGVIEGVSDAGDIRDSIMDQVRKANTTGLGDEHDDSRTSGGWSAGHIAILREIRDLAEQASA